MAVIISADEIKKTLPNYSPEHVEKFHRESTKLADRSFYKTLKDSNLENVILMNGGAASGKTEFLVSHLIEEKAIILDTTLPTIEGAEIKIKSILKARKKPLIYSVIPDNIVRAFIAFLHRDRKFSDSHFYRTHSTARSTLLWIAENYPEIQLNIIESSYTNDQKLTFNKLEFVNKDEQLTYLRNMQMSETDIINTLKNN